ncbi:MAG: DUF4224 domain-containing protein [Plesiomonas sp.]|uniref:DUF4224 domain-containing protein n=1 Tax=Plesiomonas sp. TaxID=2486279 RepID=UPI003F401FC9
MNISDIVSNEIIIELTGYKTPRKQCELLKQYGVWFIVGRDGRPKTTAEHINNPLASRLKPVQDEKAQPNFGAI